MTELGESGGRPDDLQDRLQRVLAKHYELRGEIGRGASAVVFRAWDLRLHRPVAIKVLRPELVANATSARFGREIATVAVLSHPHIVALYDSGEAAGILYFVMPLVEGESLRQRLRRERQLPLDEALRITRDVASGLQYAHDRGLVHRDVKPENILITGQSASAIADFGLARVLSVEDEALTLGGLAVGTAAYMSPEQASGDGADARSDQYALACVLFEMLAGVPPFHASTAQGMLARHRVDAPPSLRLVRETVPQGIDDALLKSMSKSAADRFASVNEFVRALEGALTKETLASIVRDRAIPDGGPTARAPARSIPDRRLAVGAVGIAILALAAVVGRTVLLRPPAAVDADSSLVAVAPFDTFDPRDEVWRTGMVDLLSRRFDGAGPLHTVSPSEVVRVFRGRGDIASATALGAATSAGLIVFGQISRTANDSIRLTGVLLDRSAQRSVEVDVRGAPGAFDLLVDSMTLRLLRELGRTRALAATLGASMGTRSLPSLKLFLQAEQARRRNDYTRALRLYEEAIAADSSFALAYRGASRSLAITNEADARSMWYAREAGQRNHRLAAIDSLMVLADSLAAALPSGPAIYDDRALQNLRRRVGALRQASRLRPGDPEVWTALADAYIHAGYRIRVTAEQTLIAFERASASDAGYAPAYFHTVELALAHRSADSTRRLARKFLLASPNDSRFRAIVDLLSDSAPVVGRGRAVMRRLPPDSLLSLAYLLRRWYGEEDFAEEAYHQLARVPLEGFDIDTTIVRRWLVLHLLHRGRLTEGGALNDAPSSDPIPLNSLLLGEKGILSAAALDTGARVWSSRGAASGRFAAATWFARSGNLPELRLLAEHAEQSPRLRGEVSRSDELVAGYARALIALAARDSSEALRRLRLLPDSLCSWVCWPMVRLTTRLLVAMDSAAAAARHLDRFPPTITSTSLVESEWIAERAETARRAGDSASASASVQRLTRIWQGGDSSLKALLARAPSP